MSTEHGEVSVARSLGRWSLPSPVPPRLGHSSGTAGHRASVIQPSVVASRRSGREIDVYASDHSTTDGLPTLELGVTLVAVAPA